MTEEPKKVRDLLAAGGFTELRGAVLLAPALRVPGVADFEVTDADVRYNYRSRSRLDTVRSSLARWALAGPPSEDARWSRRWLPLAAALTAKFGPPKAVAWGGDGLLLWSGEKGWHVAAIASLDTSDPHSRSGATLADFVPAGGEG